MFLRKRTNFSRQPVTLLLFVLISIMFLSDSGWGRDVVVHNKALKTPFLASDDLALIREKIVANGYNFKVSSNWVVELSQSLRERMRSRRHSWGIEGIARSSRQNDDLGPLHSHLGGTLPQHFDLRNVGSGRSYIGPVRHQGSCGACYAFGACAAAEGSYNLMTGSYNQACVDFSEAYIAFCLAPYYTGFSGCEGSDYRYEELDALVEEGVCLESQMPYNSANITCSTVLKPPAVRFTSWHRIPCNDTVAIKTAIRYLGVVDVAIQTNPAFDAYASGIYEDTNTGCDDPNGDTCYYAPTDHVVALVGWDDNGGDGYWILRNSWGSEWGEAGYMRIKYHSAHVACAACYLVFTPDPPPPLPLPDNKLDIIYPCLQLLLDD